MVQEPSCGTTWMAATSDVATDGAPSRGLDRQRFYTQLANALTTLSGLVYLTHRAAYRTDQKRYIEAMQDTLRQITRALHQYQFTPDGHLSE